MYAQPDPKRIAWERKRREAEQQQAVEIATCYRQHTPTQVRHAEAMIEADLGRSLGIDVSVRLIPQAA